MRLSAWVVSIVQCVDVLLSLSAIGFISDDVVDLALLDDLPVLLDGVFNIFSF